MNNKITWLAVSAATLLGARPLEAAGQAAGARTERIPQKMLLEYHAGPLVLYGSGNLTSEAQGVIGGVQVRRLCDTRWFLLTEASLSRENRASYNLHHWGSRLGAGWAFTDATDLVAAYRFDRYSVSNVGGNSDSAFRTVAGNGATTAVELALEHDGTDDEFYPTRGSTMTLSGELALRGLGGDHDFGHLNSDWALYVSPLRGRLDGSWLEDVTFAEHLSVGWMAPLRRRDPVPFFERQFVGGDDTVRGHRDRWLTPRGAEGEFIGGEAMAVNNVEVRELLFASRLRRRLSVAEFVDFGTAARRLSALGDVGWGVGAGLRYVFKLWQVEGVARIDYGISLAHENEGDSPSYVHFTLGSPF